MLARPLATDSLLTVRIAALSSTLPIPIPYPLLPSILRPAYFLVALAEFDDSP